MPIHASRKKYRGPSVTSAHISSLGCLCLHEQRTRVKSATSRLISEWSNHLISQLHSSLRRAIDMFSILLPQRTHLRSERAWLNGRIILHKLHRFWMIGLHGQRTRVKVQRVLWFHSWVVRRFWIISLHGIFFYLLSLFASVIIHQGHERKEINLCLAAFIDPPLENWDHFPRENFTTILRTDGFEAQLTLP